MVRTLDEIQQRFPTPTAAHRIAVPDDPGGAYTVGGALCLSAGGQWPCPDEVQLVDVLQALNPRLSLRQCSWYGSRIRAANDREDFAQAWQWVGRALARGCDAQLAHRQQ